MLLRFIYKYIVLSSCYFATFNILLVGRSPTFLFSNIFYFFKNLQQSSVQNNKPADNQIKCSYCQSSNTKKISASAKIGGAMMFGLFSKTAKSQFKCNNCGYKW